jgi:hypothetical protein
VVAKFFGWLEDRRTLGFGLLLAWAVYFTVIAIGNLSDLLWSFGWLDWSNRSGNLHWIAVTTEVYVHSRPLNQILLAGAVVWEGAAAVLLFRALVLWTRRRPNAQPAARGSLLAATALWFSYAIITELTVSYSRGNAESDYWVICGSSLASLLVIGLLARDPADAESV